MDLQRSERPFVFVTGMPRSGTTLMDTLLSSQPGVHVVSQPLPLLYVAVKQAFLQSLRGPGAAPVAYPLDDMFGRTSYPIDAFLAFLRDYRVDPDVARQLFAAMSDFSGQLTKPHSSPALIPDRPLDLFDFVTRHVAMDAPEHSSVVGCKEAYCEEYLPYFLSRGSRVVLVLRDPRDVLTSLNTGRGHQYGGARKPLLFTLRQWRKSVAFALEHHGTPGLRLVHYERLVQQPRLVMEEVFDTLGVTADLERILNQDLRRQTGELWMSNSSHFEHTRVTDQSVGQYRRHLTEHVDLFIQALCFTEFRTLGYRLDLSAQEVPHVLTAFQDISPPSRPELADYEWQPHHLQEELTRWKDFSGGRFNPDHHLSERTFTVLRSAVVAGGP